MHKATVPWLALAGLALIGLVGIDYAWTAPVPSDPAQKTLTSAEKIRKDLDQVVSVEIVEQPLPLAIEYLRDKTKINFVLDRLTMNQMGIDADQTPVTVRLKDVKVRTALRAVLSSHNLSFAILGDTVLISSDEVAMARQMRQRVSIDLKQVEFAKALRQVAQETATNLVVDARIAKDAQQLITLQLEDVPLETAVRLMSEMAGLKPVRVGNVLFVSTKANAAELRQDPDLVPVPGTPGVVEGMVLPPGGIPPLRPIQVIPAVPQAAPNPPPVPPTEEKPKEEKDK